MMKNSLWLWIVVAVFSAADARARGSVIVDARFPTRGEQTRLRVLDDAGRPVAGATVEVTYRPGSSVERVETIGSTTYGGGLDWVPAEAGIATLAASWTVPGRPESSVSAAVSVRFRGPPVGGILVMIVAGILLVATSVVRMFGVVRTDQAP